jgi:hypothetical protein
MAITDSQPDSSTPATPMDGAAVASAPTWPMDVKPLETFLKDAYKLTADEFGILVDQAILLLGQLYVHLPQKRALRGIDPIQRLRVLGYQLPKLCQRQFHDEMLAIFADLHDFHTRFTLPTPFAGNAAMVPFLVEECYERGQPKHLVTNILKGFDDEMFQREVEVTHWNGVPIGRAIELLGRYRLGSNPEAQHAQAIHQLTIRLMNSTPPPDEPTVRVGCVTKKGKPFERCFDWMVGKPPDKWLSNRGGFDEAASSESLGIDFDSEMVRRVRKALFAPDAMRRERELALRVESAEVGEEPAEAGEELGLLSPDESHLPDVFLFKSLTVDGRTLGYLRIWTFEFKDVNAFLKEARRILDRLPAEGLIVDIRGNPGGVIQNGELLLQMLTPGTIEPERYQFINTPLTQRLVRFNESMRPWVPSIETAVETGAIYSAGFPLTDVGLANGEGQRYQGPVVLITDALCYSSADTFAAGFQDNQVGKVLGIHHRTGAGGGNVWEHDKILQNLAGGCPGVRALPRASSFRIAIRRNIRVRKHADVLVEELGVEADAYHPMTRNDIINKDHPNEDLIAHAAELLAHEPVRSLKATQRPASDGQVTVTATVSNVERVDAYVRVKQSDGTIDARPIGSFPVTDAPIVFTLSLPPSGEPLVELRGYATVKVDNHDTTRLVVATRPKKQ